MEMSGEELINAPKAAVWEALNDPDILKQAIPGCESVEKEGDDGFTATVKVKVGPVKATFKGAVKLSNIDAPNGYTITGEGKGGAAGFGKGGADIKLSDADGGTLLSYTATASVGGKMAQIGSRLIDSTAKKLAVEFFAKFNELVSEPVAEQAETGTDDGDGTAVASSSMKREADDAPEPSGSQEKQGLMRPAILIPAAILAVVVIYYLSKGA